MCHPTTHVPCSPAAPCPHLVRCGVHVHHCHRLLCPLPPQVLLGALAAHSVRYEEQLGPSSLVAEAKLRMLQSASDLLGGAGSLPGAALPLLCMLLLLLKGKAATVAANALVEQSRITHVLVGAILGDADSLERVALRVLAQTIVAHGACASSVLHRCGVDIDELLARLPHRGSAPPRRSLSLQMCELLAALAASDPQLAARICRPRPLDALKAPLISGDPLLQLAAVDVLAVLHSQGCTRALCTEDTVPFLLEACRPIGQGTDQAVDSAGVAPSATVDQLEHLREQCVALLGELLHTPHPRCNSLLARLLEALHPSVAVRWADKLRCLRQLDASLRCAVALLEWYSPHPSEIPTCLDFCQAGAGLLGDCIDAGVADAAHASLALAGMGRLAAAVARGSSPAHAPALCHLCALLVPRSLGALHQLEEPAALAQLLPSTCELLAAMLCGSSLEGGERRALAHAHTRDCLWLLDLSSRQDAAESSARLAIALLGALERVEPPGGQPGGVELTLPCTGLHSCVARVRAATDEARRASKAAPCPVSAGETERRACRSRCTPSSSSSCSSRLPAAASTRKARRLGHRSRGARTTPRRSSRSRRSCSPFTPSRAARCTPASPSRRCCASRARAWRRCTRLTRRSKRYTTAVRRLATAFSWRFSSAALPRYFRTQSAWRGCSRARHRQHRSCRGALPPPQPSGLSPPPEGPVRASRRGECCWRGREGATPRRQRARRWPEASQSGATWSRASARAAR